MLSHYLLSPNHNLTLGGGARVIHRRTEPYPENHFARFAPWERYSHDPVGTDTIINTYAQLESRLTDTLTSTLGVKVEHFSLNNSTELQPQARLLYPKQQTSILAGGCACRRDTVFFQHQDR